MLNSISFTARFRQTVTIKQRNEDNTFQDCKAKLVELDPESQNDRNALSQTNRIWGDQTFLEDINDDFRDCSDYENPSAFKRFYAVTTQNSKFQNLKPEKILGTAEVTVGNTDKIVVKYLQVKPSDSILSQDRQYKKVGSSVLNGLKEEHKNKDIVLLPVDDDDVKKFYLANGFVVHGKDEMIYRSSNQSNLSD